MTTDPKLVEMMYWAKDKSWADFVPESKERYRLTDAAPERARKAFKKWLEYQKTHN